MHIVQVLLDQRIGGAERLAETLAQEWRAQGETTEVVLLDAVPGASTAPAARARRLRRALRATQPDLVVSHSALPNLYSRMVTPRDVPIGAVLHSAQDDFVERGLRLSEKALYRRGTVVAVSESQLETYRNRFPRARTALIPNAIAPGLPYRAPGPRDTDSPLRLVTVSRVTEQKRPDLWQSIARTVSSQRFSFDWYGPAADPASAAFVEAHAAQGAPGRFRGPTNEVGEALAGADGLLHTASREASSIGLLEAAAVGLPIICAAEVARTAPVGLVWAEFDDVESAVLALERLRNAYPEAQVHAEQWRDEVRTLASAQRCAAAYKALAAV